MVELLTAKVNQLQATLAGLLERMDTLPEESRQILMGDVQKLEDSCQALSADLPRFAATELVFENSQQKDLLKAIFKADPSGLAVLTYPDLVYRVVNEAYRAMTPHPQIDPLGQPFEQIWPGEEAVQTKKLLERVIADGQILHDKYQRTDAESGETRHFAVHLVPIGWRNQPAVLIVLWETTRLEQALQASREREEALRESEQRFRSIFHNRHSPMLLIDPLNGQIADANPAACNFYGWHKAQLQGMKIMQINTLPPEQVHRHIDQAQGAGTGQSFHFHHRLANGEIREVEVHSGPIMVNGKELLLSIINDITERRRAEAEVERQKRAFERLAANSPDAIARFDRQFRYLYANPITTSASGRTPDDFKGKTNAELGMPPNLSAKWDAALTRIFTGGQPYQFEFSYPDLEGQNREYDWIGVPEYDPSGQVESALCIAREVTDLKNALHDLRQSEAQLRISEAHLRASEAQFRFLADAMPQLVWTALPDGRIDYLNRRANEYAGFIQNPDGSWITGNVDHPDEREETLVTWQHVLETGEPYHREHRRKTSAGDYRWHLTRAVPIKDAYGRVTRWYGTSTDIHELKLAGEAVHRAEERFQSSIESLLEGFTLFSAVRENGPGGAGKIVDLRFEYINESGCRLNHMNRERLIGHTLLEVRPNSWENGLFDRYASVIETGQPMDEPGLAYEDIYSGDKNSLRILAIRATRMGDGITVIWDDVTQRKQLETEKRELETQAEVQRRLLEYREKERQEIARDLHDGPIQMLAGTIFHLQVAREATQDSLMKIELDQAALNLKGSVRELRELVNELRPPALVRFGLTKSARMHAEDFRERHPEVELKLHMIEDEHMLSEQVCLALFRIYQEGLNNVLKHARASKIWVHFTREGDLAILEIHDNGQGFTLSNDLVAHTQDGHYGLAGMRERAEAVGGRLEVFSEPGKGTTVRAKIPLDSPRRD